MTENAGLKLLAAIEAMHQELRGVREDLQNQRDATETLREIRIRRAASQKKWRAKTGRRVSGDSTEDSTKSLQAQVVILDLKQRDQKQELPASVEPTKTLPAPTASTWKAFAIAYRERYRVDPVRNAKVNGQLAQLLKRLPVDEAPEVAGFYVRHNHAKYVGNRHPVGLLLQDCEGLRTQWATGKTATASEAQQIDKTQANLDGWAELMSPEGRHALVGK